MIVVRNVLLCVISKLANTNIIVICWWLYY